MKKREKIEKESKVDVRNRGIFIQVQRGEKRTKRSSNSSNWNKKSLSYK